MAEVSATAPGKVILFGEHAVVHGQPAIAVPLFAAKACAIACPGEAGIGVQIIAANLGRTFVAFPDPRENEPALVIAVRLLVSHLKVPMPDCQVLLHSTIPVASGLGSGAAVTTALLRALSQFLGHPLDPETLNRLVFEVEKLYHGTPSGIDNTVIVYEKPVYFVHGQPPATFAIGAPLHLVVADTGVASPTRLAVEDVQRLYERNPAQIGALFERIGEIAQTARAAIERGEAKALGSLMRENHALLQALTVSSPLLDRLVSVAEEAGAYGAKLSGGGRGGNMIALTSSDAMSAVAQALLGAGAKHAIQTTLA